MAEEAEESRGSEDETYWGGVWWPKSVPTQVIIEAVRAIVKWDDEEYEPMKLARQLYEIFSRGSTLGPSSGDE